MRLNVRWWVMMVLVTAIGLPGGVARGDGPAVALESLLPADADLVVVVENLREHLEILSKSPLVGGLRRLPVVAAWVDSEPVRGFRRVVGQVEDAVGVEPGTLRDRIFGDETILVLRGDPHGTLDHPRVLVVGRARDPELLRRLVETVDRAQLESGELVRVEPLGAPASPIQRRRYAEAGRSDEFTVTFADGVFAWSNAESLIRDLLDRRARAGGGLGDQADYRATRAGLPRSVLLRLYVASGTIRRVLGDGAGGSKPGADPIAALLARQWQALRGLGLTLDVRSGVAVQVHQGLDPSRLDGWIRDELKRLAAARPTSPRIPGTAIAAVRFDLDLAALRRALESSVSEADRNWWRTGEQVVEGLLLGQRLATDILPRLGPGLLVSMSEPVEIDGKLRVPIRAELAVAPGPEGSPGPGLAIGNALRTGLSLYVMDSDRIRSGLKVETRGEAGVSVLVLATARRVLLAYASGPDRIALGNMPEAVMPIGDDAAKTNPLEAIRSANVPMAAVFAVVDLDRLTRMLDSGRERIAERLAGRGPRDAEAIARDLDAFAAATRLFRSATFGLGASSDGTAVHAEVRLISR